MTSLEMIKHTDRENPKDRHTKDRHTEDGHTGDRHTGHGSQTHPFFEHLLDLRYFRRVYRRH